MRGRLRIYLGAAPGVGKTCAMLGEAHRRRDRGTDVVVGFVEDHGRAHTAELIAGLEVVPRRSMEYRGASFSEMDVDAVLARRPAVALVDELAHTNVPGCRNAKRWQDVQELLAAGIDVISTVNIQHLESLADVVAGITGVRQQETVPDEVVRRAEQIELVDMAPEALRRRLAHGNVYAPEKVDAALSNYFRPGNLTALRELALRQTAHQLEERREELRVPQPVIESQRRESILIWLTLNPSTAMLIRRGRRVADYLNSSCTAIFVAARELSPEDRATVERLTNVCRNLRIKPETIESTEPAKAIAGWAREHGITQIFVARDAPDAQKLVHLARDMQVTIVAERVRRAT